MRVNPMKIAQSLFLLTLLPLATALVAKATLSNLAAQVRPRLAKIWGLSLLAVISLLIITNFNSVLSVFGTRAILAGPVSGKV